MTLVLKDPEASLDYAVDWGLEYLDADALAASSSSVEPDEPGGAGWLWPVGEEPPLGESAEKYRVTVQGSAGPLMFEVNEPQIVIPANVLTGMEGAVTVSVVQIGDYAASRPATASITLG